MPYNDDGYGGGTDFSATEAPEFKGYAVPAFSSVREYTDWVERRPNLTPGERQLVSAMKANPNEFESHLGSIRPKPSFVQKYWPIILVGGLVAAPLIASYVPGLAGGGAAGGGGTAGTTGALGGFGPMSGLAGGAASGGGVGLAGGSAAGGTIAGGVVPTLARTGLTTLDKINVGAYGLDYLTKQIASRSQGRADQSAQAWDRQVYEEQKKLAADQRLEDQELDRQKVARQEAKWNAEQAEIKRKSDLEATRYAARETRLAPYRAGGLQTLARLNAASQPTVTPYQSRFMGQG